MQSPLNKQMLHPLTVLRALVPLRRCDFIEALRIAELQATRLLELCELDDAPVPSEVITDQPGLLVRQRPLPMSGVSYWDGSHWMIGLRQDEPLTRQRFTLAHEYKHILDHRHLEYLYPGSAVHDAATQAEQAADYFAGCLLIPKRLLKRAWAGGLQHPSGLADHFDTSTRAVVVRLAQVSLTEPGIGRHHGGAHQSDRRTTTREFA